MVSGMPTLRRGETTIEYEVHGNGYPLLLLAPGGMRSATSVWSRAPFHPITEFSGEYRVITMDQRNAGASRAPITAADGWHSYADDQLALLDELRVERCHLLGGCIGGAFALSLMARAPERVSAAVLQQPIGYSGSNREVFYELFDGWAAELEQTRSRTSRPKRCRRSVRGCTTESSCSASAVNRSRLARCRCSSCVGMTSITRAPFPKRSCAWRPTHSSFTTGRRATICRAPWRTCVSS